MPRSPLTHIHKLVLSLFALLVLGTLVLALLVGQRGIRIESDLQSISPHYIENPAVEQAVDQLAVSLQQNVLLVAKSSSRDELETLASEFPDLIEELIFSQLTYIDPLENLNAFLAAVKQYRFHLLTSEQIDALKQSSDEQLLQQAQRQLYSITGNARLYNANIDPMGFASAYVTAMLDNLPGSQQDDVIAVIDETGEQYYLPFTFRLSINGQDFRQQQLIKDELTAIENAIVEIAPSVSILHSGVFFFSASAANSAKANITLISTGSTLGILILLLTFFRSWRTLILPLISIAIGIVFAFLCSQLLFETIHVFTIVFGASLIGVVIDYALHYAYHYSDANRLGSTKLYRALLLSLITSVIGYSALAFSGLLVLRQVAVFSVLGLGSAWLTVVALGGLLLPRELTLHDQYLRTCLGKIQFWLTRISPKTLIALYLVLIFMSVGVIAKLSTFSDSPRSFFEPDPALVLEEQELQNVIANFEPATYLVIRGDDENEVYEQTSHLTAQLPQQQAFLFGANSLMGSPQQRNQAYALNERLYEKTGLATKFLTGLNVADNVIVNLQTDYEQAANNPPLASELLNDTVLPLPPIWQQIEGKHYSFLLLTKEADLASLDAYARTQENVFFINSVGMATTAIQALRQSANILLIVAIVLVTGLMFLRYRQVQKLGMMTVPLAAITVTLAIYAMAGIAVSLFHIMALFLVLGLGMDYVIFIADFRSHNQQTLCAIILSAVTSLLAFGLLSISTIPVVHAFGLTVLIGNTINILGSLVLARFLIPNQLTIEGNST